MAHPTDVGRKRNIRYLWAYMLLGEIVDFSFAINLFFLTIISTPVPRLRDRRSSTPTSTTTEAPPKRRPSALVTLSNFTHRLLTPLQSLLSTISPYILPPILTLLFYIPTFLLPFSTSSPHFSLFLTIPHLTLFSLIYLASIAPNPYSNSIFHFIALPSILLHLKQTIVALLDSNPVPHEHKYSLWSYLPASAYRYLSASGVTNILDALSDHPVVMSVGSDVLICALGLGMWSVTRRIEARQIGRAVIGGGDGHESAKKHDTLKNEKPVASSTVRKDVPSPPSTTSEPNLGAGVASWGLFMLGGLGTMAVGVLGAEG